MALDIRNFESLSPSDLENLIETGLREGLGIEYKSQLAISSDDEKKEFLADLSSFANAKGGFLLIGIDEERDSSGKPTGIPSEVLGVPTENIGHELGRLENIARDGIEPRINGLRMRSIPVPSGKEVIAVCVPASLIAPHIVKFKGASRFYSRNSSGKYPLAYSEIRDSFLQSDQRFKKIQAFRSDRLARLVAGDHVADLGGNPLIVVHLVPLSDTVVDVVAAKDSGIQPIYCRGCNPTLNFDGALFDSTRKSYAQLYRNGVIEAVCGSLIRNNDQKLIPSTTYEKEVLEGIRDLLAAQEKIGIPYPIALGYALLGVKGFRFGLSNRYYDPPRPIGRQDLIMNEVILESDANLNQIIRSLFDMVWQECGWPTSINFDEKSEWTGAA